MGGDTQPARIQFEQESRVPIKYPDVLHLRSSDGVREYSARDTCLYALGIGMAADPLDRNELNFVYEEDQKVVPTMAAVLARGLGVSVSDIGQDYRHSVHGEQAITWHRPLSAAGKISGEGRVAGVFDKGDKGAVIVTETALRDFTTGDAVATVRVTAFARADGHCGAPRDGAPAPHAVPDRAPDQTVTIPTRKDLALLYRLTGDLNPIHIDPDAAARVGFERPILHGLCTYGIACRAILAVYCGFQPERMVSLATRFSAPVLPGDTLAFDFWRVGDIVSFVARVPERGAIVLTNGRAELRA
jgi:acyl dehydratase